MQENPIIGSLNSSSSVRPNPEPAPFKNLQPQLNTFSSQPRVNVKAARNSSGHVAANQRRQVKRTENKKALETRAFLNDVIVFQDVLFSLATAGPHSTIRQDFIYGVQGATRLTEDDLKLVQTLYTLTTAGKTPTIANVCDVDENLKDESFQTASSHFQKLMEGNPAQVGSTRWTYMYAKNLLNRIVRGGYFLRLREEQARTASAAAAIASAAKALTQDSLQLNQTTVLQPATYGR